MAEPVHIAPATTAAELVAVRKLCWDYRSYLLNFAPVEREITETFYPIPEYEALLARLEEIHARPQGIILLATRGGVPIGCGMSQGLDAQTSEIKRVFVSQDARGGGIARKMCETLIQRAQADGFERVVLDTSKGLLAARKLYVSLGFKERDPYQPIPQAVLPNLYFFQINLKGIIS